MFIIDCFSSLPKTTSSEVAKTVVLAVTKGPAMFDCVLQDILTSEHDVQLTALQMLAACLHSDTLTR